MRYLKLITSLDFRFLAFLTVSAFYIGDVLETPAETASRNDGNRDELIERFGEQEFMPSGGFILSLGQRLPELVWKQPKIVATVVADPAIPTRWFDERFEEVTHTEESGRYYVYGEAPAPKAPVLRRAMTCYCLEDESTLTAIAEERIESLNPFSNAIDDSKQMEALLHRWRMTEEGVVELAALLEGGRGDAPIRPGQSLMENATRHVLLKRKLMGLGDQPLVDVSARLREGSPAPVLRNAPLEEVDVTEEQVQEIKARLDQWYASAKEPMAVVIARQGVIVFAQGYGMLDEQPVTIDTPMLLHSAMKPLLGLQLAMYVDRGIIDLDEPIGNYLPDFDSPYDQYLTFRAGHVHVTGIRFPWDLAFSRLFYFHTWHESLIAHCKRDWAPGARHQYGVVGIILSVRALELLRGRNYWDAMERDIFEPLGIRNVLPGGTGFSAENLARIGVMLDNKGGYGKWELISDKTYDQMLPTSLKPYFPALNLTYGIGLQNKHEVFGQSSYGHGGGCGTQILVNPKEHLVFAMVRNERGIDYDRHLSDVLDILMNQ